VVHKAIKSSADKLQIPALKELSAIPDLVALSIVRFALENCDPIFKDWLSDHTAFFINVVKEEICGQPVAITMKWDDLIIRCEWKWTIEKVFSSDQSHKDLIIDLTKTYPLQFDALLVKEILSSSSVSEEKVKQIIVEKTVQWRERIIKWRSDRLK
jgi:hypothetical protein